MHHPSFSFSLSLGLVALLLTTRRILASASPLAFPQQGDPTSVTDTSSSQTTPSGPQTTAPNGASCSTAFYHEDCAESTINFVCVNTIIDSRPRTPLDVCDKNGNIDKQNPVDTLITTPNGSQCPARFYNEDCAESTINFACVNTIIDSRPKTDADVCDNQGYLVKPGA